MTQKKLWGDAYLRFHKQLQALKKGQLKTVRRLAHEARLELEQKTRVKQLNLTMGY